jgi:hypothetical protein
MIVSLLCLCSFNFFLVLVGWGFELKASHLQSRLSTAWAPPPVLSSFLKDNFDGIAFWVDYYFLSTYRISGRKIHTGETWRWCIVQIAYMRPCVWAKKEKKEGRARWNSFLPANLNTPKKFFFCFKFFIIHLFTCVYIVLVISPSSPPPPPSLLLPLHLQAEPVLPLSLILSKR